LESRSHSEDGKRGARARALVWLFIIFLWPIRPAAGQEPPYFSPENILRFADFLYQEKDYLRAAAEYRRYLSYGDVQPAAAAPVYFKIGLCYRLARDYPKSVSAFQAVLEKYPHSEAAEDSYCQIAYSHFLGGRYEESLSSVEAFFPKTGSEERKLKLSHLKGLNYLYQKKWQKAEDYFRSLGEKTAENPVTAALKTFAEQGKHLPHRSPFLAGALSTLIPGTGRIYAGRTSDGLLSLLTVAVTGWQAYEGFHKDGARSVKGWIFGSLSAFFYLGNIYGSVVAVRVFNEQSEMKFLEKIGVSVHVFFQ